MNLAEIVKLKFPNDLEGFPPNIIIQDDGKGPYIAKWKVDGVAEPDATTLQQWENEVSLADFQNKASALIANHLEEVAQSKGYDSVLSIASYVTSTNTQWKAEADAFVAWRDDVFSTAYTQAADIQSGKQPIPTLDEVQAQLPQITWPT